MPCKNKIIKLNSISRQTINNQSCIVLDNQQDSLCHVHSLALVPAIRKKAPCGKKEISFPSAKFHMLSPIKVGLFPIHFNMQTQFGYLVLGIVPTSVIPDFSGGGQFSTTSTPVPSNSTVDIHRDEQMAREWIATHSDWVLTHGILIYA